jgi:Domain of unknown function DUF11
MSTRIFTGLRTAAVAIAALGWWTGANAQTAAGVTISNTATVNYTVSGLTQAPINSSPTGNAVPGPGVPTAFLVDNRLRFTVAELSASATTTTPGAAGVAIAFTVTNTGNAPQGYALVLAEETSGSTFPFGDNDNADFGLASLQIRVDDGNGTLDAADTATAIDTLNAGETRTVFVVSPLVPLTLLNGWRANIQLQAQSAVAGTNGGTIEVETPGPNDATVVDIVFADTGRDNTETAVDQFVIQSAAILVTKNQAVLDDGFTTGVNARAIPLALVEYTITVANNGLSPADGISITDPIPATTTFQAGPGPYAGGADVQLTGAPFPTCVAELTTDTNGDGCVRDGANLVVGAPALGASIAAGGSRTMRFQVRIN